MLRCRRVIKTVREDAAQPEFSVATGNLQCPACGASFYSAAAPALLASREQCPCGGRLEIKPLPGARPQNTLTVENKRFAA